MNASLPSTVEMIFWCVVQVTALSLAALVIHSIVRRWRPGLAVAVSAVAVPMVLLLTLAIAAPIPSFTARWTADWWSNQSAAPVPAANSASSVEFTPSLAEPSDAAPPRPVLPPWLATAAAAIQAELTLSSTSASSERFYWSHAVVWGLAVLCGVSLSRVVFGMWSVSRLCRRASTVRSAELQSTLDTLCSELGLRRPITILESNEISTPATVGWRRPIVLLPAATRGGWSSAQLRVVLAHELAHVRRGDFLMNLLSHLCVAIHFYHPLVHWLAARMRLDQELRADYVAAQLNGGANCYAAVLARMALEHDKRFVGWPAPMFIPTRRTLVRRIEMLKSTTPFSSCGRVAHIPLFLALAAVALLCAGLRAPIPLVTPPAVHAQQLGADAANAAPLTISYVADDADAVVALRPDRWRNHATLGKLIESFVGQTSQLRLLGNDNLAQLTWVYRSAAKPGPGGQFPIAPLTTIVEMKKADDFEEVKALLKEQSAEPVLDKIVGPDDEDALCSYQSDATTLIIDTRRNLTMYLASLSNTPAPLVSSDTWKKVGSSDFAVAMNGRLLRNVPARDDNPLIKQLGPAAVGCDSVHLSMTAEERLHVRGYFAAKNAGAADQIAATLRAMTAMGAAALENVKKQPGAETLAVILADVAIDAVKSSQVEKKDQTVEFSMAASLSSKQQATAIAEALRSARRTAKRMQSMNNLKQIMLALHNYHDLHGHLPAARILGPDGKHFHSWRVALLPYLEQKALYDAYRFDEPWDSPHNSKLAETVIPVYVDPASDEPSHCTSYFLVIDGGTGFSSKPAAEGPKFADIRDGLSNTVMVVSAQRKTPWSKPDDLSLEALLASYEDGEVSLGSGGPQFLAGMADGAVRAVPRTTGKGQLKSWLQISDGK